MHAKRALGIIVWTLQRRGVHDFYPYHPCTVRYIYLFGIIWLFFNVLNMVFHVGKIYHSSHGMQNSGPLFGISPTRKSDGSFFLVIHPSRRLPPTVDLTLVEEVENGPSLYNLKKASSVSTMASEAGTREWDTLGEEWSFWPILKSEMFRLWGELNVEGERAKRKRCFLSTSNYQFWPCNLS